MSSVNSHTGWQPLRSVMLGDVYPVDFYYDFDPDVRDAFETITSMTKEDLDKIETILMSRNITVHRPIFTKNRNDYLDEQGLLVKPPIMPRDTEFVLGDKFYHLRMDHTHDPWQHLLDAMGNQGVSIIKGPRHTDVSCLCPPSIVRCGRDIYIDHDTHQHVWNLVGSTFIDWSKDYRVHIISTGGHSDGVFCPVRPGLIIASHWLQIYEKTFPDWQIYQLPREKNPGTRFQKWWIQDDAVNKNGRFRRHVEQHAINWIGNYQETQFSVNLLVLDEKTVLACNKNDKLFDFLSRQGIEVLIVDFRCKTFWDGGMHCLTCDLVRDGLREDYFPERNNHNYLDWI